MKKKHEVIRMLVTTLLILLAIWAFLSRLSSPQDNLADFLNDSLIVFLDLPTFLLLLFFIVPCLLICGMGKDFLRVFSMGDPDRSFTLGEIKRTSQAIHLLQRLAVYEALLVTFLQIIAILRNMDDPALLGPNLAIICLSALYAVIFEILLMPLDIYVKKHIIDYMEETED